MSSAALDRSRPPEPSEIRPHEFPAVVRRRLSNSLSFLHARSGDLPLVTVRAVLDAGAATERAGQEGLARLTTEALEGGTAARSGADLAWAMESIGAQLETLTTWDAAHVAFTTSASRLEQALDLLAEVVRTPAFPDGEVERVRGEQLAEMMRRSTDPRALADDSAARFIYADGATFSRTVLGLEERVGSFTADDVRAFHAHRFVPGRAAIIVVGDVSADEAEAQVQRAFGDWSGIVEPTIPSDTSPRHDRTTIHLVDRPGAVQSELRIGHVGLPRDTADYYPLQVMNAILGGAFVSRLNLNLREEHGFTYGVRSGFAFRKAPGPFVIQTAVESDVTVRAIEETLKELDTLVEEGVTDEEVRNARDFLAGVMPLDMQTTDQLAARISELHTYDLPVNYFETARDRLRSVTADEVNRVAKLRLQLDRLVITVVGNAGAVAEGLRGLGFGEPMVEEAPPAAAPQAVP
jgi:zinc protease